MKKKLTSRTAATAAASAGQHAADDGDGDHRQQVQQQHAAPATARRAPATSSAGQRRPAAEPASSSADADRPAAAATPRLPLRHAVPVSAVMPVTDPHGHTTGGSARSAGGLARRVRRGWRRSCHGTLVTMTPRWNSSRALSRSALWLCSSCSHQCPTTYSGMNTDDHVAGAVLAQLRRRSPAPGR